MMFRLSTKWTYYSLFSLVVLCVFISVFLLKTFENEETNDMDLKSHWTTFMDTQSTFNNGIHSFRNQAGPESTTQFNYRDISLSQKLPWQYDSRLKNPCWYDNDVLKCLPYCFIAGIEKCGTTTLFDKIGVHPESINPGFKEAQFFGWKMVRNVKKTGNINNYVNMYAEAAKQIEGYLRNQKSVNTVNKHIFCDASPGISDVNFKWWKMPSNVGLKEPRYVNLDYIHRIVPMAKIIMVFRDPIDRFYSAYYYNLRDGRHKEVGQIAGPEHFHQFVEKAISDYKLCLRDGTLRSCVYNESLYTFMVSLSSGIYHVYWQELLRVFPREQLHIVMTKDLDSNDTMRRIFAFLEMSPVGDDVFREISFKEKQNTRPKPFITKGPMLNSTRKLLYQFYKPHNAQMAALTGNKVFLFANSNY